MKMDRRRVKTDQALRQAIVRLVMTTGYDQVSTQDIAREANISRSTFYTHYEGKEELMWECLRGVRRFYIHGWQEGIRAGTIRRGELGLLPPLLAHLDGHRELWNAAGKDSLRGIFVDGLKLLIQEFVRRDLRYSGLHPIRIHAIAGGIWSVIEAWMDGVLIATADEMFIQLRSFV